MTYEMNFDNLVSTMQMAQAIRQWIVDLAPNNNKLSTDEPNPFYSVGPENCLLLEAYYGCPHKLWTPLGGWSICSNINAFGNPRTAEDHWMTTARDLLGLELLYGQSHSADDSYKQDRGIFHDGPIGGEFGPVWAITKDPSNGRKLFDVPKVTSGTVHLGEFMVSFRGMGRSPGFCCTQEGLGNYEQATELQKKVFAVAFAGTELENIR